jgi:hypothetical protein
MNIGYCKKEFTTVKVYKKELTTIKNKLENILKKINSFMMTSKEYQQGAVLSQHNEIIDNLAVINRNISMIEENIDNFVIVLPDAGSESLVEKQFSRQQSTLNEFMHLFPERFSEPTPEFSQELNQSDTPVDHGFAGNTSTVLSQKIVRPVNYDFSGNTGTVLSREISRPVNRGVAGNTGTVLSREIARPVNRGVAGNTTVLSRDLARGKPILSNSFS